VASQKAFRWEMTRGSENSRQVEPSDSFSFEQRHAHKLRRQSSDEQWSLQTKRECQNRPSKRGETLIGRKTHLLREMARVALRTMFSERVSGCCNLGR
jgi:hypothetical protein